MAEERGSRTHQTRLTRLIGFEIRARHRIETFFRRLYTIPALAGNSSLITPPI